MDHTLRNLARRFGYRTGKVLFGFDNSKKENYAISEDSLEEQFLSGWRDMRSGLVAAATGAGTPALIAFGPSGNIKQRRFGVNDSVYVAVHVDHDIKVGSTLYPHVHWSTDGTSENTVKWQFSYTTAKGFNQEAFPADSIITVEEAASGTAWQHMVTEDETGFLAPEVDSVILIELKRITNGGSENADAVFGIFVDLHYQTDRYATIGKRPDFYTAD